MRKNVKIRSKGPPPSGGFTPETGFSVSGDFVDGGEITITRAAGGFGTKNGGGKPLYWFPFESSKDYRTDISRGTASLTLGGAIATDQLLPNSAGAYRYDLVSSQSSGFPTNTDDAIYTTTNRFYLWMKKRYNFTFTGTSATEMNLKPIRFWPDAFGSPNLYYGMNGQDSATGDPRVTVEVMDQHWPGTIQLIGHLGENWATDEFIFAQSSAIDVSDGVFHHLRNASYSSELDVRYIMRETGSSSDMVRVYLDQRSNPVGGSIPDPAYVWYDSVYVDDSWARVIVSSEPSFQVERYTTATEYDREIQLPLTWSDTEITVELRKGVLTSFTGKYLYAITSDETAHKIGVFE